MNMANEAGAATEADAARPQFNPLDPELAVDPFPILARLRAVDPVFAMGPGAYIVTGHAAAWEVLKRKDGDLRWEQFQRVRHGDRVVDEPYFKLMADSVLMKAGADHHRVRRTFQRNFTPPMVEAIRPQIEARAHELIDGFAADGRVELMERFASPLPLSAISQLLRVPREDETDILQWMHGFKLAIQMLPLDATQLQEANDSMGCLDVYFRGLVEKRRAEPIEDLVGKMIDDTDAGRLTEDELIANLWSIYVGGHDTSALSIANALVTLLRHPDQLELLLGDMSRLDNAVEEIIRHIGTVHGTHRLISEEIELGGHTIPPDTPIMVYLSAANHDEAWCPRAEEFDISREVPHDHLGFGTGPHKCPGQHMARAVVGIAVETVLSRLRGLRIEELEWDRDALLFRGPKRLVISWVRTS
jgi:pimeloyl-[acyl-carrier protein] synthase